jgi:hypothetical protein
MSQSIDNVLIDGARVDHLNMHSVLIGIEGTTRDYMLILDYPNLPDTRLADIDRYKRELLQLVSSFRPMNLADDAKRMSLRREQAEASFDAIRKPFAASALTSQVQTFVAQVKVRDVSSPDAVVSAVEDARRLAQTYRVFELDDAPDELDALVQAHDAGRHDDVRTILETIQRIPDRPASST